MTCSGSRWRKALAFLQRRRVAQPAAGEWLAYMKFRREAFIKGPADKPYLRRQRY
jgi:hypothetical protein